MSTVKSRLQVRSTAAPATALVLVRPNSPLFSDNGSEKPSAAPDAARRSYSDVAVSRPPSPAVGGEKEVVPPPNQMIGQGERPCDSIRIPVVDLNVDNEDKSIPSSDSSDPDQDEDPREWTTMQRKHRGKKHGTSKERLSREDVPAAVDSVLVEAEKSLMKAEKQRIALQQKKVNPPEEVEPCKGGPSGSKGKGVDPRNWGNVQLNEEEANVEAQPRPNKRPLTCFMLERNKLSCLISLWL